MCDLGFHICPHCSEEYSCKQSNFQCEAFNYYEGSCAKCENLIEEQRRDLDREERMRWERMRWEQEHSFVDGD